MKGINFCFLFLFFLNCGEYREVEITPNNFQIEHGNICFNFEPPKRELFDYGQTLNHPGDYRRVFFKTNIRLKDSANLQKETKFTITFHYARWYLPENKYEKARDICFDSKDLIIQYCRCTSDCKEEDVHDKSFVMALIEKTYNWRYVP